jgi:hypothetical protein
MDLKEGKHIRNWDRKNRETDAEWVLDNEEKELTSFRACACIINNSGLSNTIAASLLFWAISYESFP